MMRIRIKVSSTFYVGRKSSTIATEIKVMQKNYMILVLELH